MIEEMDPKTRKDRVILEANANDDINREYRFRLECYVFMEGEVYISYCPSLDISTSGRTFNEAVSNFLECFQLHIEWCVEHKTLLEDLKSHGWRVRKSEIEPPSFSSLLRKTDIKHLISGSTSYEKVVLPARVSL